jgi:hypothetical protein
MKMQPVTAVCKRLYSVGAIVLCLGVFGCAPGVGSSVDAVAFAKKTLSESYAAKAELGEVLEVIHKTDQVGGHGFSIKASKQNATLTLLTISPSGEPEGTLWLEDGRQIPLFIPFLEESYKSDLGL